MSSPKLHLLIISRLAREVVFQSTSHQHSSSFLVNSLVIVSQCAYDLYMVTQFTNYLVSSLTKYECSH